jgi:hypothetical protein
LDHRKERIRYSSMECLVHPYSKRFTDTTLMDPDPLHLPDREHETPMMTLSRLKNVSIYGREEIVRMLVEAGAVADENLDQKHRIAVARKRGGESSLPPFWGLINCQLVGDFLVFITIHKNLYSVDVTVDIDMLLLCIDKEKSVLPPASMTQFNIRMVFMRCMKQRFNFDPAVDGVDFDLHFNMYDTAGTQPLVVGCMDGGDYKLAIRFPRGPCPTIFWTAETLHEPVFICSVNIDKQYTLAHYAATTKEEDLRRRLIHLSRPLCNPLLKCTGGLTAASTLENSMVVGVTWDVKRLLAKMRRDEKAMLTYIHRDSLLLMTGFDRNTTTKTRQRNKSPFHDLSDDICRVILSFL